MFAHAPGPIGVWADPGEVDETARSVSIDVNGPESDVACRWVDDLRHVAQVDLTAFERLNKQLYAADFVIAEIGETRKLESAAGTGGGDA